MRFSIDVIVIILRSAVSWLTIPTSVAEFSLRQVGSPQSCQLLVANRKSNGKARGTSNGNRGQKGICRMYGLAVPVGCSMFDARN